MPVKDAIGGDELVHGEFAVFCLPFVNGTQTATDEQPLPRRLGERRRDPDAFRAGLLNDSREHIGRKGQARGLTMLSSVRSQSVGDQQIQPLVWVMLTIHPMPNSSTHMPNSSPHICISSGTETVPLSASFAQ